MSLGRKRSALQADLELILGDPGSPMSGIKLSGALSKFSAGILPPTIGIFTGVIPSALVYTKAPEFQKTKGIEDAINTFASFNAAGMAPFAFTGTAPPKIKNLQMLFDIVRARSGTVKDIAKAVSYAILINYTLGRATFNPLSIIIPTWNIPGLPSAVSDALDQNAIDAKMIESAKHAAARTTIEIEGRLEQDSFFDRMSGS